MRGLSRRIMEHAEAVPEATPLCPAALLHLGNRAAVDQALSRLARSGELMRICQGVYMRPIETRFGFRAPRVGKALAALSALWGETIVPLRRCRGQLPWPDHAESSSRGLSHLRPAPAAALRLAHRRAAPRSALAAGGPAPQGGGCHPRPGVARSRRCRRRPRSGLVRTLRGRSERARGRAGRHAHLDGGTGERAPFAWLRRDTRTSRSTTGATPWKWRSVAAAKRHIFWRRTSGSSRP